MFIRLLKKFQGLIIIICVIIFVDIISYFLPKEEILKVIVDAGFMAPIVYIFIHLLTYIFAPISGTSVTAIGFFLFGEKVVIYSYITVILSSVTNFYIARRWGSRIVEKLVGNEALNKYVGFVNDHGYTTLILARVFLHGFSDITSYFAGLSKMKFLPYFLISVIASIPGTIVMYLFSSLAKSVTEYVIYSFLFVAIIFPIFLLLKSLFIKKGEDTSDQT
jgi:uncharacterized membrane protein YdjX (TVP38/TMEM64 family)